MHTPMLKAMIVQWKLGHLAKIGGNGGKLIKSYSIWLSLKCEMWRVIYQVFFMRLYGAKQSEGP